MIQGYQKVLSSKLIRNSRQPWDSHQRHKFWRAEASRNILKIRVLKIEFPGVFNRCFPLWMPCCSVRIHARRGTLCRQNVPGIPQHNMVQMFHRSVQCHSKLGNGCFTILFDGAYFLLAIIMVERDTSSQLRMGN